MSARRSALHRIQGNVQFFRELVGVERAAREVASADLNRGDFSAPVVRAQNNFLRSWFLVDVDFAECDSALAKELPDPPAIAAPECTVDCDVSHCLTIGQRRAAIREASVLARNSSREQTSATHQWI